MAPSDEVNDAVGEAGTVTLEQRRDKLRRIAAQPTEKEVAAAQLAEVEREIAERDAAALKREAERRLLGIKRAMGSLVEQLDQDDERLREAAERFAEVMVALNVRFDQVVMLRHEARALTETFGFDQPELPSAVLPGKRDAVRDALAKAGSTPIRDHGYVHEERVNGVRSFGELGDAPGRAMILRALAMRPTPAAATKAPAADEARIGT